MYHIISEYSLGEGGRGLPNKGRYGCATSAEFRPCKISPRNLISGKKCPKNLMTDQVFNELGLQKQNFSANRPLFVHSFIRYYTFLSKIAKSLMHGPKLTPAPEKPNARANITIPTFIRESFFLDIHSSKLENS